MKLFRSIVASQSLKAGFPVISGGTFCLAAEITRRHGLRAGAAPFDWLFCPVRDLIAIMEDDFRQFLNPDHYKSIPEREGRPSCFHSLYGDKDINRPLFNHKDPTKKRDYEYYIKAVDRFRVSAAGGAILFVVEEGSEIETQFDQLIETVRQRYRSLIIRGLRHESSGGQVAQLVRIKTAGLHELWRFCGSSVTGGVALQKPQEEELIVRKILSSR